MPRIRTIKPEFFRHEGLQDLEVAHPGAYAMLVFAGLWCHCDKAGRFRWKPRQLKLDILPFLDFDIAKTLALLEAARFIRRYEVDGEGFGDIPTFREHQRISGTEAMNPEKHPAFPGEAPGKQSGSTGEAPGTIREQQEGNGVQEEEGIEGKVGAEAAPPIAQDSVAKDPNEVEQAVHAWNSMALTVGLPQVQKLTEPRRRALTARLADCKGLAGWGEALERVRTSPFLLGRMNGTGHDAWRADFDFLIAERHFQKLIEGGYDRARIAQRRLIPTRYELACERWDGRPETKPKPEDFE